METFTNNLLFSCSMIDIKLFREKSELIKDSQKKRGEPLEIVDEILEADKLWRETIQRVEKLKQERDNEAVLRALAKVRDTACSDDNVMPVIIEAVKAYATVGEISDALRVTFGEYREPGIL